MTKWSPRSTRMEKWESEKCKSWGIPAEGFKGHVATDGSLPWDFCMVCMAQ